MFLRQLIVTFAVPFFLTSVSAHLPEHLQGNLDASADTKKLEWDTGNILPIHAVFLPAHCRINEDTVKECLNSMWDTSQIKKEDVERMIEELENFMKDYLRDASISDDYIF